MKIAVSFSWDTVMGKSFGPEAVVISTSVGNVEEADAPFYFLRLLNG